MTPQEIADTHALEWRKRLIHYLIPRLAGDEGQKEDTLDMITASLDQAYNEGTFDCAGIVQRLADANSGERSIALRAAEKALRQLHTLNSKPEQPAPRAEP